MAGIAAVLYLLISRLPVAAGPCEDAIAAYRPVTIQPRRDCLRPLAGQGNASPWTSMAVVCRRTDNAAAIGWYRKAAPRLPPRSGQSRAHARTGNVRRAPRTQGAIDARPRRSVSARARRQDDPRASQKAQALCESGREAQLCRVGRPVASVNPAALATSWFIRSITPSGRGQIVEVRRFFEPKKGRQ
jgi:hypothetical protein